MERLASSIRQFESELGGAHLDPEELTPRIDAGAHRQLIRDQIVAVAGALNL